MAVKARLDGHAFDLQTVAQHFGHGDVQVGRDDKGYYLTCPELDAAGNEGGKMMDAAQTAVRYVNGAARALASQFEPVRVTGTFEDQAADGSGIVHQVIQVDTVHARGMVGTPTIIVNGVVAQPPPSPAPDYVSLVQTNKDVRDALRIMGTPGDGLDWGDLYKVWEIVSKNVGGWRTVVANGWISEDDFKAFQSSAHHQDASGDAARHARHTGPVHTRVLTIYEGRALIRELVVVWLPTL
jgi:hypothetical protein